MKLKEINRLARRVKADYFKIDDDSKITAYSNFFQLGKKLGYYTGKDNNVLGTTIEVDPLAKVSMGETIKDDALQVGRDGGLIKNVDFEDTDNWVSQVKTANDIVSSRNNVVYLATGEGVIRVSDHHSAIFKVDNDVDDSETDMLTRLARDETIKKYADDCVKEMYSQEFDHLEYLFEGAPVITNIKNNHYWHLCTSLNEENIRLPTIEESPLNTKLAWHPRMGEPEGIDNYYYSFWGKYDIYPRTRINADWENAVAFMLLKKK